MGLGKGHELTDAAWAVVAPLLPATPKRRGRPWAEHRRVINGILWVLATGVPWRDAPERYGPWQTLYERFARWTNDGTWERVRQTLLAEMQRRHRLDWSLCCVDGSSVRALTAAAGARKKNAAHARAHPPARAPRSRAGHSRGGWGSKLHVVCDRAGVVLAFRVTPGQVIECTECEALLDAVHIGGTGGVPRTRPDALAGDKGYSTLAIRAWCHQHRIRAVIPERSDQVRHRSHRRGRKPCFDSEIYRARNIVERVIGWLKRLRRVAARAEKLAVRYSAMISLALIARTANLLSDTT